MHLTNDLLYLIHEDNVQYEIDLKVKKLKTLK